jgi:hypothetical protein
VKRILIGLIVLLAAVLGVALVYLNEIVGGAIERGATYALGVDTRVGFVRLRPWDGTFRISSFRIDNPPGFDESDFLRMGSAFVAVSLDTLREDVVLVPRFQLDRIQVALEREGKETNYGTILKNLKRFESGDAPAQAEAPAEPASERRFIVKQLVITDVTAHVEWSELAADQSAIEVAIPKIELKDIGAHNAQGVAMQELTNIIVKAILGSIARYGGDLPGAMLGQLSSGLGALTRVPGVTVSGIGGNLAEAAGAAVGGEVGDAIRGVGGSAAKSVGDAVGEETGKALGGLFRKKSDDSE